MHEALSPLTAATVAELVREVVEGDYVAVKRDSLVKQAGYQAFDYHERSGSGRHRHMATARTQDNLRRDIH